MAQERPNRTIWPILLAFVFGWGSGTVYPLSSSSSPCNCPEPRTKASVDTRTHEPTQQPDKAATPPPPPICDTNAESEKTKAAQTKVAELQQSLDNHNNHTKVLVLGTQCGGTSWLVATLGRVPGMEFAGEELLEYSQMTPAEWQCVSWDRYRADLTAALTPRHSNHQIRGFKLQYDQLPTHLYAKFGAWMRTEGVYVIHLRRKSAVLQRACLFQRLERVKKFGNSAGFLQKNNPTPEWVQQNYTPPLLDLADVNVQAAVDIMDETQRQFSRFVQTHIPHHLEINYEDLDGPNKVPLFNAVSGFLGSSHRMTGEEGPVLKAGTRTCESRVAHLNYSLLPMDTRVMCAKLALDEAPNATTVPRFLPEIADRQCVRDQYDIQLCSFKDRDT